ncbi:hypothetical protein [Streptomyces syringium]|uniref:hypothetical protein n=1 Tax=Streptomyces syringium TaxID=76729 RepID=UPI0034255F20
MRRPGWSGPGRFQGTIPVPGLPQVGRAGYVQHHRWAHRFADYEVYFLQTDRMGGRCTGGRNNVAVVTQRTPDQVTAVPSPIADGRAALGVRFGDDWYFTFHARPTSRNNPSNESDVMLARIAAFVNQVPGRSWTVGADFNNEPGNFALPPAACRPAPTAYTTGLPTHEGRRELDYVVASVNIPNHPRRRLDGASADHWAVAVAVGGMRAGGEPQPLFTSPGSANAAAPPGAGSSHPSTPPPDPTRQGTDTRGAPPSSQVVSGPDGASRHASLGVTVRTTRSTR